MKKLQRTKWLGILAMTLFSFVPQANAQENDDLQDYLDQLAAQQKEQTVKKSPRKGQSVEIPVGLTEVDLSMFSSYRNRKKTLTTKASVKFVNGTISSAADYAGNDCLLKVYGGATVVLGETAAIDASASTAPSCLSAVGIYEGSTFYQCGDIHQPKTTNASSPGYAIYLNSSADTYVYVSGILDKDIYPTPHPIPIAELLKLLQQISDVLASMKSSIDKASSDYSLLNNVNVPNELYTYGVECIETISNTYYNPLKTQYDTLNQKVQALTGDDDGTLYNQLESLLEKANLNNALTVESINNATENIKAKAAADLQQKLTAMETETYAVQDKYAKLNNRLSVLQTGDYYFMRKATDEFNSTLNAARSEMKADTESINSFISTFNSFINHHSISTIGDVMGYYNSYASLNGDLTSIKADVEATEILVANVENAYKSLTVIFPSEEDYFSIRPSGLNQEIQMGFKSNRGFVLTASGLMSFEQVSGADFRLKDFLGNYVALTGAYSLRGSTKEEATVWTGSCIGNGRYAIAMKNAPNYYMGYEGVNLNSKMITSTSAYAWSITVNEMDEAQAYVKLLEELQEEADTGGNSGLTEKDTLVIPAPIIEYIPGVAPVTPPTTPYVFPTTPYPIHVINPHPGTGYWPIPCPTPGKPRPKDFHPIYIPKGSHVIFDDVMFYDLIGGDHVIYVEGTVEINITITIKITNWEWFLHVGPGGRVIWRTTGGDGTPRIKNEGTFDFDNGNIDYVENYGTWNHRQGTVTHVVNHYIYYFYGGIVNLLHNYGTCNHQNGEVYTAYNYNGGTYTMTGGYIRGVVTRSTETVFVNYGTFYFRGGIIGGYGSRLIYHGKGATMYIDGGHFDFTYITHYWIEAYDHFYIRGDYNYNPTVPLYIGPQVTIRILYKWIYKWNIVFVNGRPTPRFPLFWADGFKFTRDHFVYIGWDLPNHRWRWYLNETENTIEPRDESVEDEDDLQAYLDWLAANKDGEAQSSEENPQVLDLAKRVIYVTKPVVLPVGTHIVFRNGTLRPQGTWVYNYIVNVPVSTSIRFENIAIDNNLWYGVYVYPVEYLQGNDGRVYIGRDCRIYFTNSVRYVVRLHFSAKDIILRQPIVLGGDGYILTADDCKNIVIDLPSGYEWKYDDTRHAIIIISKGDANNDDNIDVADISTIISYMAGKTNGVELKQVDANGDGVVDVADIATVISMMAEK